MLAAFSIILQRKGWLDIGLLLAKTLGSRVGLITATLEDFIALPVNRDRLIISSIEVLTKGEGNLVGIESKRQVDTLDEEIAKDSW